MVSDAKLNEGHAGNGVMCHVIGELQMLTSKELKMAYTYNFHYINKTKTKLKS